MPRTPLEPRFTVEYLSVLDAEGNLDAALDPGLPAAELKRLYRAMLLGRRLDERMLKLQRQGRIGTFAPIKGQEAAQLGIRLRCGVHTGEVERMRRFGSLRSYAPDEALAQVGQTGLGMTVILSGEVRITSRDDRGTVVAGA